MVVIIITKLKILQTCLFAKIVQNIINGSTLIFNPICPTVGNISAPRITAQFEIYVHSFEAGERNLTKQSGLKGKKLIKKNLC